MGEGSLLVDEVMDTELYEVIDTDLTELLSIDETLNSISLSGVNSACS